MMGTTRLDGRARLRCSGDDGSNLIEYAMLVSLIALVAMSAIQFFASATTDKMECASSNIRDAGDVDPTDC